MKESEKSLFEENYRVVAVDHDHLVVRGVHSGQLLTILNPQPGEPLTPDEFPPGKLIALSDPTTAPVN
jgi:hypothetical protein